MPGTRVLKPKAVEAPGKSLDRSKPLKAGAASAARQSGASSCSRCPQQRHKREGSTGALLKPCLDRRTRSGSTAPKTSPSKPGTNPERRRASSCPRQVAAAAGQKEQRSGRTEAKHASHSHKAFTVIPPNPKKRRDIQRKAEAELAALEELRLSRAMTYVSINPSSVGGCMSLEEVRLKQQQEMMQARRKPNKPVWTGFI
ncbi:uncharacterized protein V6R79_017997 [Siganus canaliculatus]